MYKKTILSKFNKGETVLVAMGGDVESSVVAWAAKEAGCLVKGVTLYLYGDDPTILIGAKNVADFLGIEWTIADYRDFFSEDVIGQYVNTYKKGESPNPCCICNRVGKTKYLFDQMQKVGATKIVTGHYANVKTGTDRSYIAKSLSAEKDQSYFMCLMDPFHIELMHCPLGSISSKDEIIKIAHEIGIPVTNMRDNFEACFLCGEDYRDFMTRVVGNGKKGDFVFKNATVGTHKGIYYYTIGQHRGLDLSYSGSLYIKNIDFHSGDIELCEKKDVFFRGVRLHNTVFSRDEKTVRRVKARLRYKMPDADCLLEIQQGNRAVILFDLPQFAPAPGQIAALYDGDMVIGGGVVENTF